MVSAAKHDRSRRGLRRGMPRCTAYDAETAKRDPAIFAFAVVVLWRKRGVVENCEKRSSFIGWQQQGAI